MLLLVVVVFTRIPRIQSSFMFVNPGNFSALLDDFFLSIFHHFVDLYFSFV